MWENINIRLSGTPALVERRQVFDVVVTTGSYTAVACQSIEFQPKNSTECIIYVHVIPCVNRIFRQMFDTLHIILSTLSAILTAGEIG